MRVSPGRVARAAKLTAGRNLIVRHNLLAGGAQVVMKMLCARKDPVVGGCVASRWKPLYSFGHCRNGMRQWLSGWTGLDLVGCALWRRVRPWRRGG